MGGFGSGRQGHRAVIEQGLSIDLRKLHRQGIFKASCSDARALSWANGARCWISYSLLDALPWFRIEYAVIGVDGRRTVVDERIWLEPFHQPFGGHRWYFICPATGARVQTLHCPLGATRFRSRQAYAGRVRYLSQGLDPWQRSQRQAERLRTRMLEAGPAEWREKYREWEFPPKPPGMRWQTYCDRGERFDAYEAEADRLGTERVVKLFGPCLSDR